MTKKQTMHATNACQAGYCCQKYPIIASNRVLGLSNGIQCMFVCVCMCLCHKMGLYIELFPGVRVCIKQGYQTPSG